MQEPRYRSALIVGTGPGLSASLARLFAKHGLTVAVAARQTDKLAALAAETGASVHRCNAAEPADVAALFAAVEAKGETPDVVVYNASARLRAPLVELAPEDVKRAIEVSAFGAFLVSQQAARRMLPKGRGAILLTGATAGVKGFPLSATFAMGKFALRGLAQSMARELAPKGIHVAHFVIDGGIRSAARPVPSDPPDSLLDPDAIAETYWAVLQQHRSAWSWEVEVRPWVEKF
ncbi:SDR family NAD(P)-dependent oxidoreductase [Enhydrobacter sp.]|jgi:NAD(P)-dependent dehydrogenase (short-subunit alcohol dehydrogenase family)|uniref:SDR family NAD(P)-dependent oxidoreductase n=1 Tax=Enhydrobacter sp. TaxID=1894999 RepID=UPI00262C8135|nr:SDR family NAD(P)-dependent oxidoreductase [Enhydrobacter sp.]WIM10373.1 MAG: Short-chain dehydrogenase, associated with 2-hydroxychromene-2-carboxylate isomerase family protein [Enhydrobacter sp.]